MGQIRSAHVSRNKTLVSGTFVLLFILLASFKPSSAMAAATGYLRLDRIKANTATGGSVCINPNANQTTVRQLQVTFPVSGTPGTASSTTYGVNQTGSNWTWDTTSTNIPTGTSAFPGTPTTSTVSSGTVTFIDTADATLNTGTTYCLHFTGTSTLTTPTAAADSLNGTMTLRSSGGTLLGTETVYYASSVITNDTITVTAVVPQVFTLTLSGTSLTHGTLTPGTVSTANVDLTIGTNAGNGWLAWIKPGGTSLTSALTGGTIPTGGTIDNATTTLSGATYGWQLDVIPTDSATAGTGTVSQSSGAGQEYDGNGTGACSGSTAGGTFDSTQFQPIAAANGPTDGDSLKLCDLVRVSALQKPADDYTQTIVITAAGRF